MLSHITARNLLIAGLVGQIAFEAYAWLISPLLFGVTLQPTNLVVALAEVMFDFDLPHWAGFGVHFAIGAIGFSSLVLLTHLVTKANLILSGLGVGVGLWFLAQGFLAQAVGRTFMMGFGAYTQSSFVAHVGITTLMAFTLSKLATVNRKAIAV